MCWRGETNSAQAILVDVISPRPFSLRLGYSQYHHLHGLKYLVTAALFFGVPVSSIRDRQRYLETISPVRRRGGGLGEVHIVEQCVVATGQVVYPSLGAL